MATTATPGSDAPTAPESTFVPRFGGTERALHWVHAATFFGMLASGLILYLPALASIASRPTAKAVHLAIAVAWLTSLLALPLAGDRRQLRRTRREIERFVDDDLQWLIGKRTPQGRFNAGQKVHTILQAVLAGLLTISGTLLWLGERNTTFRLSGSIALHDIAMYIAVVLVLGHLFLAVVWPHTRPALRGMVRGSVRRDWAAVHHAAWTPTGAPAAAPDPRRRAVAAAVVLLGIVGGSWVVHGVSQQGTSNGPSRQTARTGKASTSATPEPPNGAQLEARARALDAQGRLPEALALYDQAVAALPRQADVRAELGFAQARSGDRAGAETTLAAAARLDPELPQTHLYLGAVLLQPGTARTTSAERSRGRREIRSFLRLAPGSPNAPAARQLLRAR